MSAPARGWLLLVTIGIALIASACTSTTTGPFHVQKKEASRINAKLGAQYLLKGRLRLAKAKLDKALGQNPANADAHATYALLQMRLEQPEKAREHFEAALELKPDSSRLLNNYGTFLCGQGQYDQGIARFLQAASDPLYVTPAYAYANAGRCARQAGDIEQARRYLHHALEADPRIATALFDLASLELAQGQPARALHYIERYHDVATAAPGSLWLAIRIARALHDERLAERYGKQLLRDFPDSPKADRFLETM